MCTIRPAEPNDVDTLVRMGEDFFAFSAFSRFADYDPQSVGGLLMGIIESQRTLLTGNPMTVLVAEVDGKIVGGIVGVLTQLWFNNACKVASELAWWVAPEHRRGRTALKLYQAFEAWAKEQGAAHIVMSDLVVEGETPAAKLFEKLGYAIVERAHMKGV